MYDREKIIPSMVRSLIDADIISVSEIARKTDSGRAVVTRIIERLEDKGVVKRLEKGVSIDADVISVLLKIRRKNAELVAFAGNKELRRVKIRIADSLTYEQNVNSLCVDLRTFLNSLGSYRYVTCALIHDKIMAPIGRRPSLFNEYYSMESLAASAVSEVGANGLTLYLDEMEDMLLLCRNGEDVAPCGNMDGDVYRAIQNVFGFARPDVVVFEEGSVSDSDAIKSLCVKHSVKAVSVGNDSCLSIVEREAVCRLLSGLTLDLMSK